MANDMPDIFELRTPVQWKAISHPLRLRILDALAGGPRTNEEIAAALGERSGKLYFHTKRLLDAGMIVLDHTRQKGPITEKLYRAAGCRFLAPPPEKGGHRPPFEDALVSALELYRGNWHEMGGLPGQIEGGFHLVLALTPERGREFAARLTALFEDFRASGSDAPDTRPVSLAALMHSFDAKERQTDATQKSDGPGDGLFGGDGPDGEPDGHDARG